jgi:hypothetical protein
MASLSSPQTSETARGRATVDAVRQLLAALGADNGVLHRVALWVDTEDRPSVYIPPLPHDVAERLARLEPRAVDPC